MRLLRYIPLLGLKSRDTADSNVNQVNQPSIQQVVTPNVPIMTHNSGNIGHHHNHQHAHAKLHEQHLLHPTQKAYSAHLQAKESAQKRISEHQIILKRNVPTFRPLIITNHLEEETVYPAYSSKQQSGGFQLKPGDSHTVELPLGQIDMLRVWVRRGCISGPNENDLTCIHGDCNGKLVCNSWGNYGVSAYENAIFPSGNPRGSFLDTSLVEGATMLPVSLSMDD
ncbi:MAG: hypothetical protein EOP45_11620, partial [Sphingobacteriaceae bacterium]